MLPREDGIWTLEFIWQTEWLELKGNQLASQGGVEVVPSFEFSFLQMPLASSLGKRSGKGYGV